MDRTSSTNQFCTILKDFLKDMYKSYPDTSLMMLVKATEAMILTNPSGVVENFVYCIEPYIEKILCRDESFFLEGGLTNDIKEGSYSFLTDELNKVVKIWNDPNTSTKTKNAIWKYFELLVKLGLKASGR